MNSNWHEKKILTSLKSQTWNMQRFVEIVTPKRNKDVTSHLWMMSSWCVCLFFIKLSLNLFELLNKLNHEVVREIRHLLVSSSFSLHCHTVSYDNGGWRGVWWTELWGLSRFRPGREHTPAAAVKMSVERLTSGSNSVCQYKTLDFWGAFSADIWHINVHKLLKILRFQILF